MISILASFAIVLTLAFPFFLEFVVMVPMRYQLRWTRAKLRSAFDTILGRDLDDIPYHTAVGIPAFVFLAGFVAAQQTFLGLIVKGHEVKEFQFTASKFAVIAVGILTLVTFGVQVRLLRLVRKPGANQTRAFDEGTIIFGRWSSFISLIVSLALCIFSFFGWLPWQIPERIPYTKKDVTCVAELFKRKLGSLGTPGPFDSTERRQRAQMDRLLTYVQKGFDETPSVPNARRTILWVEQTDYFREKYNTFKGNIELRPGITIVQAFAFLVSDESGVTSPVQRQLAFDLVNDPAIAKRFNQSRTFEVRDPNPGERIVIWLSVEGEAEDGKPERFWAGLTAVPLE